MFQMNLTLKSEAGADISTFVMNGEWDLLGEQETFKQNRIEITWLQMHFAQYNFSVSQPKLSESCSETSDIFQELCGTTDQNYSNKVCRKRSGNLLD